MLMDFRFAPFIFTPNTMNFVIAKGFDATKTSKIFFFK